ncbi:MAG: Hsp20/alpha crystallin family protein [Anaerolineaceae bacterium]|nr:Hsp20/alpha crystallin family protein [Anaerolineaceae bacterium]
MSKEKKSIDVQKQEVITDEAQERTRECQCYAPRADIFETETNFIILTDMPGVDEDSVDITLEKNTLSIRGYVDLESPQDHTLSYAEYGIGDYERNFVLSNEIDRDKIEATVKNGVLRLFLPKLAGDLSRKIEVKAA